MHRQEVCPNCGYCPTCGRRDASPHYPWTTPWVVPYATPYWHPAGSGVNIKTVPDVYIGDPPGSIGSGSITGSGTFSSKL